MHIITSEYQTANPFSMKIDRMKEKMKKNSFKLAVLECNNLFSRWSIDLNITVCIFADGLIYLCSHFIGGSLPVFNQINLEIPPKHLPNRINWTNKTRKYFVITKCKYSHRNVKSKFSKSCSLRLKMVCWPILG